MFVTLLMLNGLVCQDLQHCVARKSKYNPRRLSTVTTAADLTTDYAEPDSTTFTSAMALFSLRACLQAVITLDFAVPSLSLAACCIMMLTSFKESNSSL